MNSRHPTLLDLYNEWRSQCLFQAKGVWPKKAQSLDNVKDKDKLIHFEKFSKTLTDTDGLIDWKLYISSLASFYCGWFGPELLNSQKSIHIYKTSINIKNVEESEDDIYAGILRSLKFIIVWCNANNIKNFDSYLFSEVTIFPPVLKHLSAGSITHYFLAIIPHIDTSLSSFPKDVVDACASDFLRKYKDLKRKVFSIKKIREISDVIKMIDALIKKGETQKTQN